MGTTSLVFGLILIGVGIYILLIVKTYSDVDLVWDMFVRLVIALPSFVIGGLLLRKYDKDRKKEKGSYGFIQRMETSTVVVSANTLFEKASADHPATLL